MRRKDRSTEESLMGFRGIKWSEGELCSKKGWEAAEGAKRGHKGGQPTEGKPLERWTSRTTGNWAFGGILLQIRKIMKL
ncbi:MAG: hypothetical protein ACTS45_00580 [Candidatus Hodgkinia cicadicola]